jgi:thiosulfate/3-mercaptopyruvate sulfurtransferase
VDVPPIVDADWVLARTDAADPSATTGVVLADVRWYLDGRSGREAFEAAHLPGAVFVDLDTDLSASGPPEAGRHPFPSPEHFAARLGALGLGPSATVIGYDDGGGGGAAARLVWMLRILGRPAALLDGGVGAWTGPVEHGPGRVPAPLDVPVEPWPASWFVDHQGAADAGARPDTVLLDARARDRFRGENEVVDPRAGHIPGARSAPWAENVDPHAGRFRPDDELEARYRALGVDDTTEVVAYCGSGVSACTDLLVLEHLGLGHGRLFAASWSGWSADPGRPLALGDE